MSTAAPPPWHLSSLRVTSAPGAARRPAARQFLTDLAALLGRGGLAVAAATPGLLAAIDQHAAAIRDTIGDGWRVPGAAALAGYAQGLRDRGAAHLWEVPSADQVHWPTAEWPVLRLVAVCALARQAGIAT